MEHGLVLVCLGSRAVFLSLSQICSAKLLSLGALRYKNNIEPGMICRVSFITASKIKTRRMPAYIMQIDL